MKRYELEAKNKEDLREHADVSGIKWSAEDTKGTLIDRILGELPPARDEPAEPPKVKKQADAKDIPLGALFDLQGNRAVCRKFRLMIFATDNDKSDVDIIVNSYNIRVKRGVEVIVDEPYIAMLRNAVIDTVVQDPDTGVRTPQQVMVYPHSATPV